MGDLSCASVPPRSACRVATDNEAPTTIVSHHECWGAQTVKTRLLNERTIPSLFTLFLIEPHGDAGFAPSHSGFPVIPALGTKYLSPTIAGTMGSRDLGRGVTFRTEARSER